jgi:hypothetical protein
LNTKCVFWSSLQTLPEILLILRRSEWDMIKNIQRCGLHVKCCYSCQILIKIQISRQTFEKYSNINFMKIRQVGAKMFHADGRRNGQRDTKKASSCFSQFCERA